jgi:hypothetical protein
LLSPPLNHREKSPPFFVFSSFCSSLLSYVDLATGVWGMKFPSGPAIIRFAGGIFEAGVLLSSKDGLNYWVVFNGG